MGDSGGNLEGALLGIVARTGSRGVSRFKGVGGDERTTYLISRTTLRSAVAVYLPRSLWHP